MAATAIVIAAATDLAGLSALPAKVLAAGVSFLLVFALRRSVVFSAREVPGESAGRIRPDLRRACARCWIGWRTSSLCPRRGPSSTPGSSWRGLAMFASAELAYVLFSPAPSFFMPSVDGFGGTAFGRDFLNTWMGGRSALAEGPAAWFDFRVYNDLLRAIIGITESYFWSYPPHVLLFIWPFGLMPYLPAFVLWTLGGFALFLYAAARGGVERKHLLFVAVAPAVAINVFIGQNGFFTAALLIGGLVNLDRRPAARRRAVRHPHHQAAARPAAPGGAVGVRALAHHRRRGGDDGRTGGGHVMALRRRHLDGLSQERRAGAALPARARQRHAVPANPIRLLRRLASIGLPVSRSTGRCRRSCRRPRSPPWSGRSPAGATPSCRWRC